MAGDKCAYHLETPARYRCDGCQRLLCDECIEESYKLLLCKACGERALPLSSAAPATVDQRTRTETAKAGRDYSLGQALLYPFRGSGLFMFIAALLSMAFMTFVRDYGITCLALVFYLGWLSLLVGIRFKIVQTTADWKNELPDWPEYFSIMERVVEILTFLVIALLQYGPLAAFLAAFGIQGLFTTEPSLFFWIGAAAAFWLGMALSVMAWGAAGAHWRHLVFRIDLHIRGLFAVGGDALKTVNVTFLLFGLVILARGIVGASIPLAGRALAGTLWLYWAFLTPHLVGILFRRHSETLTRLYEG